MPTRIEQVLESEQRRAKKVEMLIGLLRDPDLSDVVGRLIEETPHSKPSTASSNGHLPVKPGAITEAIRAVATKLPNPFTIHDAVDVLTREGFKFTRKAKDQVRDSLYFIVREPDTKFRVIEVGRAGKLSRYEYVN
jgi:hypothetical protein